MAKSKKKEESNDEVVISLDSFAVPGAILIAGVIIAVAVFLSNRNKGVDDVDIAGTDTTTEETDSAAEQDQFPAASTTIGDSPFLGDQNAQVAVVEFNEYKCGFCLRHKDETLPLIIENYVDTGKIKYVFKEFAIYGDDAANAAKCVYHIAGIDKYVEFHKGIFEYESDDDIYALVEELGVNEGQFDACYTDKEYQSELDADKAAGTDAGVQGTPGFVIGTIDEDGNVTGNLVPGAYPYENFVELLEGFLSE